MNGGLASSDNPAPVLRFENVSFGWPGYPPVIEDFSAELMKGEIVCIIGASGCGKTTLLNLAGGFILPGSGRVSEADLPVEGPARGRLMVFQDSAQLFPWLTVGGNAAFPDNQPDKAARLLDMVGLSDASDMYPSQLSGGMKQRAVIARALASEPEVLLLDEPFTALDAPTRRGLQDMLLDLNAELGVSMLFVTHDIREAVYLADRIIVLSNEGATVVEVGSRSGLERSAGRRDEFRGAFVALERRVYELI